MVMGYLREMRSKQQSEPHIFIHMNPLSRNPGSAPDNAFLSKKGEPPQINFTGKLSS